MRGPIHSCELHSAGNGPHQYWTLGIEPRELSTSRWVIGTAGVVVVGAACLLVGLGWSRQSATFLNDGPFRGEPRADCPTTGPDQEFPIWGGMALRVFDPESDTVAPTVALAESAGATRWCVRAVGWDHTKVREVRFLDRSRWPFFPYRVRGIVDWTYGREGMWWFLEADGDLKDYWYSW